MKILIATVQVPFVRGGAEILADELLGALRAAGHDAGIVAVPYKSYPAERILDHMAACRLLRLNDAAARPADLVIGLKFPAYLIPHANKVLWLMHQHRTAYELWDHPLGSDIIHSPHGDRVREAIQMADRRLIPEAKAIFTIARNVSLRLKRYCDIDSVPLYQPPHHADRYFCAPTEDYLFFPSRLTPIKRQGLVLEALSRTRNPVRVRFAGSPDYPPHGAELVRHSEKLGVAGRVEWIGPIGESQIAEPYARSLAVLYPPLDEDYGFVTLEAMLSSKPVITCKDSGGPLEFIADGKHGIVAEPCAESLAEAMDTLWEDRRLAKALGEAGRDHYSSLGISWENVVGKLVA